MAKTGVQRKPDGTFAPGQTGFLQHGAEQGVVRLRAGLPFDPETPAHAAELAVFDAIERSGLRSYLESRAVQVEAVCDLFYSEIAQAAEAHDAELLDARTKRWGWLRGVADRTWKIVLGMGNGSSQTLDGLLKQPVGADDGTNTGN